MTVTSLPSVRLVGGSGPHEGRLEVFMKGEWGTVCDPTLIESINKGNNAESANANTNTICRHLGFSGGSIESVSTTDFGKGRGTVWLSKLRCREEYGVISDCVAQWGSSRSQCEDHSHDLAIKCNGR